MLSLRQLSLYSLSVGFTSKIYAYLSSVSACYMPSPPHPPPFDRPNYTLQVVQIMTTTLLHMLQPIWLSYQKLQNDNYTI